MEIWESGRVPDKFWNNLDNHRKYVSWLMDKLNYKDYHQLKPTDFSSNYGTGLFDKYSYSLYYLISALYPNEKLFPWLLPRCPKNFWSDINNIKTYLEWLKERLGYKSIDDLYQIQSGSFKKNFGHGLLDKYHTVLNILQLTYPDKEWIPWYFAQTPQGFWKDKDNIRSYLNWLGDILGVKSLDDWYDVSVNDIRNHYGRGLLDRYNNLFLEILKDVYPEKEWHRHLFIGKKTQLIIYEIVLDNFPDAQYDYKHPNMLFSKSKRKMELDIWIPSLNLGIEYQGFQHFTPVYGKKCLMELQKRDAEKRIRSKEIGINLEIINYYDWDGNIEFIKNTLDKYR